jgi:lipopolysaccharide transport system permease protein
MSTERVFVVRAHRGIHWPPWGELWEGRQLLYLLAKRDVQLRYSQTVLGILWVVAQPLATMLVLRQLVSRAVGAGSDTLPTALFIFAGLVPWLYFSTSVSGGSTSLASNSTLLTKVYFPRILVPLAPTLAALVDLGVGLLAMIVVAAAVGATLSVKLFWLFPAMLTMVLATQGVTVSLGALGVRYRDIRHAIPFLLQFGMLASPVLYPERLLPPALQALHQVNPLSIAIAGVRSAFLPGPVDFGSMVAGLLAASLIWLGGVLLFYQFDRSLADRI